MFKSVQVKIILCALFKFLHFNTTFVKVQGYKELKLLEQAGDFNTTFVKVQDS